MTIFKPPRDPNKPKRPSTAYFHFMADFRAKMKGSDISHKDVIRWAGFPFPTPGRDGESGPDVSFLGGAEPDGGGGGQMSFLTMCSSLGKLAKRGSD